MPSFSPAIDAIASPAPQRRIVTVNKDQTRPPFKFGSPAASPGNRRRKEVGDYWLGKTLGKGSSGRVKVGVHKVTGEKVAVKIISKSHLAANVSVEKAVKREIAVMKLINHPNIMSLVDVIDLPDSPNLYLILEYVQGGELFEYLVSQGRLPESEARKYFQQIIFGLDYCHRHLICHRDLKPENLLFDKDKNIKIADFGMASLQPTGSLLETSCGSPHYASPEIVNGVPYDGSASDIWSCGIILYALLCGHLPFDDDNIRNLLNKVKVGKYKIPDHVSTSARDLIEKILIVDPKKRLTMRQVQEHAWFTADPPPNPSTLPDPPTAAEIGRPVASASEIDDRLLATLKDLWTDLSTSQLIAALLNNEYNMQKVTYVLLQRHAASYWQIEHDDDTRAGTPAKRRRPATICAVANNKEPFPGLGDMMIKLAEKEKTSNETAMAPDIQHHSLHPQPFTKPSLSGLTPISNTNDDRENSMEGAPPPVPPKPKVIRADLIYNQTRLDPPFSTPQVPHRQWPCASAQPPRRSPWHPLTPAAPQQQAPQSSQPHNLPRFFPSTLGDQQRTAPTTATSPVNATTFLQPPPFFVQQSSLQHTYMYNRQLPTQQQQQLQQQQQQHQQHQQQQQQHLNIGHMVSPRVSANHFPHSNYRPFMPYYSSPQTPPMSSPQNYSPFFQPSPPPHEQQSQQQPEQQQQPQQRYSHVQHSHPQYPYISHPLCSPDRSSRVDPSKQSNKSVHRFSVPSSPQKTKANPYYTITRKAVESSSSTWREVTPPPDVHMFDGHSRNTTASTNAESYHGSGFIPPPSPHMLNIHSPRTPSSPFLPHQPPTRRDSNGSNLSSTPRLSSWLPGLFHFKQPKVCSLDCLARDEHEAINKIAQVLRECMDGSIVERQDSEGRLRRKGEMRIPHIIKPIVLRFKLELGPIQQSYNQRRMIRVNFVQQQGDAMALAAAVKIVQQTLQTYEQEAELLVSSNGWVYDQQQQQQPMV